MILCGGSGTRLLSLSRKSFPKKFAAFIWDESLFAALAQRLSGANFKSPVVVTGSNFRFIVTEQLLLAGIDPGSILIEPEARHTAPAVLVASLHVAATYPPGQFLWRRLIMQLRILMHFAQRLREAWMRRSRVRS
jgi:mannose-1-phosphate guanylyltransferase